MKIHEEHIGTVQGHTNTLPSRIQSMLRKQELSELPDATLSVNADWQSNVIGTWGRELSNPLVHEECYTRLWFTNEPTHSSKPHETRKTRWIGCAMERIRRVRIN